MTSRNRWVKMVWGVFVLAALLMTGLAQAQTTTSLQVFIAPVEALAAGAQWQIQGEIGWRNSGDTADISLSTATSQFVDFKPVAGWIAPSTLAPDTTGTVEILIVFGQVNATTATFTAIPPTELLVFIEPPAAAVAGCQWRRQGDTIFHDTGFIDTAVTSGPVVIEFQAVLGWIAPPNQNATIQTGQTTTRFGIFTEVPVFTGLRVTIDPPAASLAGAQWRFVSADETTTTLFQNSGVTVFGLTSSTGTVEFSTISGWVTPANILDVTIVTGQTAQATGTYILIPTFTELQVFIEPGLALAAGAEWRRVGTIPYFGPGFVESGLTSGPATVEFKPIPGWITPANEAVVILTDQRVQTTGTYVALPAATRLQVFIEPTSVTLASAQWRLVSATTTTLFLNSGATAAGLTSGPAVVEFSAVTGWIAPANRNVTILTQQLVVTTGTYTLAPPVVTALQVFIEPPAAVAAGALWRIQGETTYNPSGFIETGLTAGPAVVEFSAVADWVAPANQNVTLVTGQTVVTSGTYVQAGSLQITIEPAAAVAAGAQWRRVGTITYLSDNDIESVPAGTYAVEFKPTPGWTTPANLAGLVVVVGQTTPGTGTYTELEGGAPGNYKISYKGCQIALDSTAPDTARGLIVTGANAATIKIQKLTKVPTKHADVPGKTLFMLNSPGLNFLTAATGTIKSLSGTGAFIPSISANVTGSIKMGVAAVLPGIPKPATSILLPGTVTDAPRAAVPTLKVSLTGVSLDDFVMTNEAASIKIAAKKVKGATIPADVTAGATILAGNGLSLGVTGGNIYADLIESQGGIKSLSVKGSKTFSGGNIGPDPTATTTATLATLADTLTSPTVAVLLHPSTPVVVSLTNDIGKISGANVDGVFVAGANLVNGLVHPTCSAAVKTWKATNASGDAFVSAAAKSQPAGIAAHTTAKSQPAGIAAHTTAP